MKKSLLFAAILLMIAPCFALTSGESLLEKVNRMSSEGVTLPIEIASQFPFEEQIVENDSGINVLIDLSHGCAFHFMWRVPKSLRANGLRSVGSHACLDTMLKSDSVCRTRVPAGGFWPFAWIDAPRFNVVLTSQSASKHQPYTPEEIETLVEFVASGGGLFIAAGDVSGSDEAKQWSLNTLAGKFGAAISPNKDSQKGVRKSSTIDAGADWEIMQKGDGGMALCARRQYEKGRVVILSAREMINYHPKNTSPEEIKAKEKFLTDTLKWAGGGAEPVGGTLRLPVEMGGGGPIYPSQEKRVGNIIFYYAKNQFESVLKIVNDDLPVVKKQVEEWLPSKPSGDHMNLIMASGGGGGWAVNAYLPKEAGIITQERRGIIGVFAHELAHTMGGPPNANGETAGKAPHGNQGEAHAGWFQTKAYAKFIGEVAESRLPNYFFKDDKDGTAMDLAMDPAEFAEKWGKGKNWKKTWYIWQKLDDRYGPAWYPRWRWVQHTRWADDPERQLTWSEMVEDMSIAVSEDLFPFFKKIGTTLDKERYESATFMGEEMKLPVAPIEVTPAGDPIISAIDDYKLPIVVK